MTKDEALDLALEALEYIENNYMSLPKSGSEAITAIKQARSAPVQEPVAIVDEDGVIVVCNYKYKPGDKLYTTPPAQRQRVVFPTMIRKMWSGGEVQAWLDENVNKENT
jgi:hypothetical protein